MKAGDMPASLKRIFLAFRDNLMNTNDKFDYGGFRALVEKMQLMNSGTTVFTYKFSDPGNYVFKLSSNSYRRMVRIFLFVALY